MSIKTSLKVAVLGPTGQCGSCVVDELLSRGHTVVGISRNPPKGWKGNERYSAVPVDIQDTEKLAKAFSAGFDAIVCAFSPSLSDLSTTYENGVEGHGRIKTALLRSDHTGSFIVIGMSWDLGRKYGNGQLTYKRSTGGAGSLHGSDGVQLVDRPEFAYSWWYRWPDVHLNYMRTRAYDHKATGFGRFITGFKWARANIQRPGCRFFEMEKCLCR